MKSTECKIYIIGLLLFAIILSGCQSTRTSSAPVRYHYQNPNKNISSLNRIAIVELKNDSSYPQMSNNITESLFQSIQKRQTFSLTIVQQRDPLWRSLQLEPDTTYTLDQMAAVRETIKCDGVLIGTITEFKPYPHMAIGLRLKLIDLTNGELMWAVEQVWSSSDKMTCQRIKKYFKETQNSLWQTSNEKLATVCPLEFIKFVSYEVAQTL